MIPYNVFRNKKTGRATQLMLVEKFGRYNHPSVDKGKTLAYWITDWPEASLPNFSAMTGWTKYEFPKHTSIPSGDQDKFYCHGVDWDPVNEVMGCVMGCKTYNAWYGGTAQKFFFHRSYDYGVTWDAGVDISPDPVGLGEVNPIQGFWYWSGYDYWDSSPPEADSLRYIGNNTWICMGYFEGIFGYSDDGGDTWDSDGASKYWVTAEYEYFFYSALYAHTMHTNWVFSDSGPFKEMTTINFTSPTIVTGETGPMVAQGASGVVANSWNVPLEARTDYDPIYYFSPIWTATPKDVIYSGARAHIYVPGTAGGVWLSAGQGYQNLSTGREMFARTLGTTYGFTPAQFATKQWLINEAFQLNAYDGWVYGPSLEWPTVTRALSGARLRLTPPVSLSPSATWRTWHISGQNTYQNVTLCKSDNEGLNWQNKSDYSTSGISTIQDWLDAGMHPILWPGQGYPNGSPHVPPLMYIADLMWNPSDPLTLISTGYVASPVNKWFAAGSYDGGDTWENMEEILPVGSGGPEFAYSFLPLYNS